MYLPEIKFCAWVIWENHVKLLIMWKVHTHNDSKVITVFAYTRIFFEGKCRKLSLFAWVFPFFAWVFPFFSWVWVLLEGFSFKMLICKPDPESVEFVFLAWSNIDGSIIVWERRKASSIKLGSKLELPTEGTKSKQALDVTAYFCRKDGSNNTKKWR